MQELFGWVRGKFLERTAERKRQYGEATEKRRLIYSWERDLRLLALLNIADSLADIAKSLHENK